VGNCRAGGGGEKSRHHDGKKPANSSPTLGNSQPLKTRRRKDVDAIKGEQDEGEGVRETAKLLKVIKEESFPTDDDQLKRVGLRLRGIQKEPLVPSTQGGELRGDQQMSDSGNILARSSESK